MTSTLERIAGALSSLGKRKPSLDGEDQQSTGQGKRQRYSFRPWHQGDMHRRLQTFRPLLWFGKPDMVSPVECAARGWCNEARDQLCCEFCNARLMYPQQLPVEARQRAAELFSDQLSSRHASHCPWKSTRCGKDVLAFNPATSEATSTSQAMHSSFQNRLSKLERMEQLPDMSGPAVDNMTRQASTAAAMDLDMNGSSSAQGAQWAANSLRQVLALPAPGDATAAMLPDVAMNGGTPGPAFNPHVPIVLPSKMTMAQKARLLALLGWEAEELPAGTGGRASHLSAYRPSNEAYGLAHLVGAGGKASNKAGAGSNKTWSMDNVVLTCPCCKSRVGLWNYIPGAQQPLLALPSIPPATPKPGVTVTPSTVIEEINDNPMDNGLATRTSRQPSVPLVRTIAGGSYDANLSIAGAAFGAGVTPVFGHPAANKEPVYGLQALSRGVSSMSSVPSLDVTGNTSRQMSVDALPPRASSLTGGAAAAAQHGDAGMATPVHAGVKRRTNDGSSTPLTGPASLHAGRVSDGGAAAKKRRMSGSGLGVNGSSASPFSNVPVCDTFDPLGQHRSWCPWVYTGDASFTTGSRQRSSSGGTPAADKTKASSPGRLLSGLFSRSPFRSKSAAAPEQQMPSTPSAKSPAPAAANGASTPGVHQSGQQQAANGHGAQSQPPITKCGWMHLLDTLADKPSRDASAGGQQDGHAEQGVPIASTPIAAGGPVGVDVAMSDVDQREEAGRTGSASKDAASIKNNLLNLLRRL